MEPRAVRRRAPSLRTRGRGRGGRPGGTAMQRLWIFGIFAFFAALGVLAAYRAYWGYQLARDYAERGVRLRGEVTADRRAPYRGGEPRRSARVMEVSFVDRDGRPWVFHTTDLPRDTRVGAGVTVVYLPGDPASAAVDTAQRLSTAWPIVPALIAVGLWIAGVAAFFLLTRRFPRPAAVPAADLDWNTPDAADL